MIVVYSQKNPANQKRLDLISLSLPYKNCHSPCVAVSHIKTKLKKIRDVKRNKPSGDETLEE
jgi:hypothetical protein